jgi:hypothetical protein
MAAAGLTLGGLSGAMLALSGTGAASKVWTAVGASIGQGDLATASTELSSYESLSADSSTASSALTSDLSTLGSALKSGDRTAASAAYAAAGKDRSSSTALSVAGLESLASQAADSIGSLIAASTASGESSSSAPSDPFAAMIDAAYGLSSASGNSMQALLESRYA